MNGNQVSKFQGCKVSKTKPVRIEIFHTHTESLKLEALKP
jgi:hypothetical protein